MKKIIETELIRFPKAYKIEDIQIGKRLRTVTETEVERIAKSISEIGLGNLITVRLENDQPHLVSGHARLLALKSLGHTHVACTVLAIDEAEAALHEIDENLVRAELSPEERRQHVRRRKELWDQAESQVAHDAPLESRRADGRGHRRKGFAAETAAATGMSKSQINRLLAEPKPKRPKALTPGQKAARTRREGKKAEAYFQKLNEQQRQQWVSEGRRLEDYEAGIGDMESAVTHWLHAWGMASDREKREAWLLDHPGNPLPEHLCSLTDAEGQEYERWLAQRKPASQERVLALKSQEHLSLLKAAWDGADIDARDKFRLYITEAGQEPKINPPTDKLSGTLTGERQAPDPRPPR
jgi:hypothetical protein